MWEQAKEQLVTAPDGDVIFDDPVAGKNYSRSIELVRRQYSGNTHSVIGGIGIVTCLYVNPETEQFWLLDYRIFKELAYKERTVYQIKFGQLSDYLIQQLKSPSVKLALA